MQVCVFMKDGLEEIQSGFPICTFLGVFEKLRKATNSVVMCVRLSVRIELGSHWTDFREI